MKPKCLQSILGATRALPLALLACLQFSHGQDQQVNGNLTVSGWAKIAAGLDIGPGSNHTVDWDATNTRVTGDINTIQGSFVWRDTYAVDNNIETARNKLLLDTSNLLRLYQTDGSTVGITLDPNAGKITLPAGMANAGIYLGSNPFLKANSTGGVVFPSRVTFENGADFGAGNTLNASNVGFLRGALTNLGYQENPAATPITRIPTCGNLSISGSFGTSTHLYVTGRFYGSVTIGTIQLDDWSPRVAGFLAKCNPDGTVVWAKKISTVAGHAYAQAISVNSAGTVAVVGQFYGTTNSFGTGKELVSVSDSGDGFVAVYDSSGNAQWTKAFGGPGSDSLAAVAIGSDGTVVAGGSFDTATTVPLALANAGGSDVAVLKFSSSGSPVWARAVGGTGSDSVGAVTLDGSGNVIVSGTFMGALTTLGSANRTGGGSSDGFLVKLGSVDGTPAWSKAIGGVSDDATSGHLVDISGDVFAFGGFCKATTTLESGRNLTAVGGVSDTDAYVLKTDANGASLWIKALGGTNLQSATKGVFTADGKLTVAGGFVGSTSTFGTGLNLTVAGGAGDTDIFLAQLDPVSGNVTASQRIGGSSSDSVYALATAPPSGVFLAASTQTTFSLGNTRMVPDCCNAAWQGFAVATPQALPVNAGFGWSGGLATGTGSTAIGGTAFALGDFSSAFGNSSATGTNSFAAGSGIAAGTDSFAAGSGVATGTGSIAMGGGAKAIGGSSIVIGNNSFSNATNSISLGISNWVYSGAYSVALGNNNYLNATAGGMFVIGEGNYPYSSRYGAYLIGVGNGTHGDLGEYSFTIGGESSALGNYSMAIGMGAVVNSYMSTALGTGNIGGGTPDSWVETDPLLEVGNKEWGSWDPPEGKSNAITTLKNGRTTLTNKAWKADNDVTPTAENSQGNALVVEGHTELKGNTMLEGNTVLKGDTVLKGRVIVEQPQGDISIGIYGGQ